MKLRDTPLRMRQVISRGGILGGRWVVRGDHYRLSSSVVTYCESGKQGEVETNGRKARYFISIVAVCCCLRITAYQE